MTNPNDFAGIKAQFLRWDKAIVDGRIVEESDLIKRRTDEFNLYASTV